MLSRRREWEAAKLTYLQSDATIIGGQSGGVLVSNAGEVIGISGLGWPGAWEGFRFAMVASAADLASRISALTAGEDSSGLGRRRWQTDSGAAEQDFVLDNQRHARMFTLQAEPEAELEFELSGSGEFSAEAIDLWGQSLGGIDQSTELTSTFTITVPEEPEEQTILLVVQSLTDSPIDVHVSSSVDLFPQDDPDDGRVIGRDATTFANMDYPGDVDYFQLSLTAGDTVEIIADSMLIDPMLSVDYRGAPEEAIVQADESVGIYEDGDKLTFTAPHTGRYYVTVYSPMTLGYAVQVKEVPSDTEGTPTPAVADDELEATTAWYRSKTGPVPPPLSQGVEGPTGGAGCDRGLRQRGWRRAGDRRTRHGQPGHGQAHARRVRGSGRQASRNHSARFQAHLREAFPDCRGPRGKCAGLQRPGRHA